MEWMWISTACFFQNPVNTQSYLVYFWGQNLNFPEPLEGIIIGLAKQSDRFPSFSKSSNNLHKNSDANEMLWYLKENEWKESVDVLYWLTSCRESVIGSFSSVSSSSKTGLVEVDGSSSSFFSILWTILREQKYTSITGRTWRQFGGSQFNLMFLGKMTNKTTTKEMRGEKHLQCLHELRPHDQRDKKASTK